MCVRGRDGGVGVCERERDGGAVVCERERDSGPGVCVCVVESRETGLRDRALHL